jgi:4-aminobutyrate aminotransferase-like enzyme
MARQYNLVPRHPHHAEARSERIATDTAVRESISALQKQYRYEPRAFCGQPLIVWDHPEGLQVCDARGDKRLARSFGILTTNIGYSRKEVKDTDDADAPRQLLTTHCFPRGICACLANRLAMLIPELQTKTILLTTGSEAVAYAIKLRRTHGIKVGGPLKAHHDFFQESVSRPPTKLGADQLYLRGERVDRYMDPGYVQMPFPDGFGTGRSSFKWLEKCPADLGVKPDNVAGLILKPNQGGSTSFASPAYMQALRQWCDRHNVRLICHKVQAGFGLTGTSWGFVHYEVVPDLACFGKGIGTCLPLAAVAGGPPRQTCTCRAARPRRTPVSGPSGGDPCLH